MEDQIARIPKEAHPDFWIMTQSWEHLAFLHWPVSPEALRQLIPEALEIDTFDGEAWIGLVPFRVSGSRLRYMPELPFTNSFLQLNVRTYVKDRGKPGVYFFSIDASSRIGVYAANLLFRLPCYTAEMSLDKHRHQDWFTFQSHRYGRHADSESFIGRYRPVSGPFSPKPGSLEHWLTNRYVFYCTGRSKRKPRMYTGEVYHQSWKLYLAEASIDGNSMTKPLHLELLDIPALAHYSRGVQALLSPLRVWKDNN